MYAIKTNVLPSFVLVLMGTMDCLTTVIGVIYFGAAELNPVLSGVVHSSIFAFMVLKLTATFCTAGTYILAKKMLNKTEDKTTKSFRFTNMFVKSAYTGLVVFLLMVVANNLVVMLA
ncbi:MAG TPA: DUF5658 family protein [Candidatus Deferrimicrobiaceae bacterium]|nr:DUF5658 family protein [Candidatus Deferrimicrobiaceae bacterium]